MTLICVQLVYLSTLYNDNAQNNNFRPPLNIFFLTLYHDTLWKACLLSLHFTMIISQHNSSLNRPWTLIILDLESGHCTNLQDWNTWTFKLLWNFYRLLRVLIVSQAPTYKHDKLDIKRSYMRGSLNAITKVNHHGRPVRSSQRFQWELLRPLHNVEIFNFVSICTLVQGCISSNETSWYYAWQPSTKCDQIWAFQYDTITGSAWN
jgi:hypothetical protein